MKILLIEDNPGDADLIKLRLDHIKPEEWITGEAIDLEWVQDLKRAEEILTIETFNLVLLDLGLSNSTGLETLGKFTEINDQLPIIVLPDYLDA